MINRQRFGIFLATSALVGGYLLPASAAEFTPAPGATAPVAATPAPVAAPQVPIAAPAPVADTPPPTSASVHVTASPAKVARSAPAIHAKRKIVARIATPTERVQPRAQEYEVASTAPASVQCRYCGYPMLFGIAY